MKKTIIALVILCTSYTTLQAQKVYNEILQTSTEVAKDKNNDLEKRKVATFKVDALKYMLMKTKELMPDSSMHMVDVQAYAMYCFVNNYITALTKAKKKKDKELVKTIYKEATIHCPRFNDMDKELILAYYNNENFLTQFVLDCDWEKALKEVENVTQAINK
ncbi:hypothetical protein JHU38_09780 [Prevotella sp. A2931]|uniref:DUF4476 domain-containing protein n=1 Tax=Prevotella illustrans TaxID=2800387 RepID=A0ABS3M7A5_9BACT|nr:MULTISPECIES: hypothetical protein [Prevotella]MBO1364054.1 hypothetical protein [Prevotella illustrans]PTL25640.1 hypothetical protein C3V39_00245 [Prevotella sp. oral taxon 820]